MKFESGQALMHHSLYRLAKTLPPNERPPKPPEKVIGGTKLALDDAQILEARRLHEREHVDCNSLARQFNVSFNFMRRILDYELRVRLVPKR